MRISRLTYTPLVAAWFRVVAATTKLTTVKFSCLVIGSENRLSDR